jgi:hypothetical protein
MHWPAACRGALPAIGVACLATACFLPLPGGHAVSTEVVAAKEAEDTLIARGGATCRVRAAVFDRTRVGDEHRCAWRYIRDPGTPGVQPRTRPERRPLPGQP